MNIKQVLDTLAPIRALGLEPTSVELHPDDVAEVKAALLSSDAVAADADGARYVGAALCLDGVPIFPRASIAKGRVSVRVASGGSHTVVVGGGLAAEGPRARQEWAKRIVESAVEADERNSFFKCINGVIGRRPANTEPVRILVHPALYAEIDPQLIVTERGALFRGAPVLSCSDVTTVPIDSGAGFYASSWALYGVEYPYRVEWRERGTVEPKAAALLLSPLLSQRRAQDDEFSRGWNAACAAMRSVLEGAK